MNTVLQTILTTKTVSSCSRKGNRLSLRMKLRSVPSGLIIRELLIRAQMNLSFMRMDR